MTRLEWGGGLDLRRGVYEWIRLVLKLWPALLRGDFMSFLNYEIMRT